MSAALRPEFGKPETGRIAYWNRMRLNDPEVENTARMSVESYMREGLAWMHEHGLEVPDDLRFNAWRDRADDVYVVEFQLLEVL